MKKRIAIAVAITASFALWAAVSPQSIVNEETSVASPETVVAAPQTTIPELTKLTAPLTTETEEVDGTMAEPVLKKTNDQPSTPTPTSMTENQVMPTPELPVLLEPVPEASGDSSADMAYLPGFG